MHLYNKDLTKCNFDKSFLPKLMLYPAELQAQKKSTRISKKNKKSYKRVERTTFCLGEHKKGEYLERFLCVFIKRFDKMQF